MRVMWRVIVAAAVCAWGCLAYVIGHFLLKFW